MITIDKQGDLGNRGIHLYAKKLIAFVFSELALGDETKTVGNNLEQIVTISMVHFSDQQQGFRDTRASTNRTEATLLLHGTIFEVELRLCDYHAPYTVAEIKEANVYATAFFRTRKRKNH